MQFLRKTLGGFIFGFSILSSLLACASISSQSSPTSRETTAIRPSEDLLTEEFAQLRKEQIRKVDYQLAFYFQKNAKEFRGKTKILLDLNHLERDVSIDAKLTSIQLILVNGKNFSLSHYNGKIGFFEIPRSYFQQGKNEIEIAYTKEYSKGEDGLLYFIDPIDQREYLATNSEPYRAHSFFPCFDQPDLKATFRVEISTPKDWVAINNAKSSVVYSGESSNTHVFLGTFPISTYLVFIGAGEYKAWYSQWENIPLTIYARKSLAKYMDAQNLFSITKKGLKFYNSYFGFRYPFQKYDHIFVPDLGSGAMENPGAVTMNERMIFRSPQPESAHLGRSNTLLHEMAHMWFGDLVTMKWWNDLWLNESFATFMAHLAQEKALGIPAQSWQSFISQKSWAYWQDQLNTTHPIVTPVSDTQVSSSNFDGITYAKGASSIKQLRFFVGDAAFRKGVQNYFKNFAWQNTERSDFLNSIATAANKDLTAWSKGWLESEGLNRSTPEWTCSGNKIQSFTMKQEATISGIYLPHRSKIALFQKSPSGEMKLMHTQPVAFNGEKTQITSLQGKNCPDFVYTNFGDEDYILANLDAKSLNIAKENINNFSEPMVRQMLWQTLYQMVRDSKLPTNHFLKMASSEFPKEKNNTVLSQLIGRYSNTRELYWNILTVEERNSFAPIFEQSAWQALQSAKGVDEISARLLWLDHFIAIAHSPDAIQKLQNLLADPQLDQDRRWKVIVELARAGDPSSNGIIEAEKKRDPSDQGGKQAFAAAVAFPTQENKEKYWGELSDRNNHLSIALRIYGGQKFHDPNKPELSTLFVQPFFTMISGFDWSGDAYVAHTIFDTLFPSTICSASLLETSELALQNNSSIPPYVQRSWKEANFELNKCIEMRAYNQNAKNWEKPIQMGGV